MLKLIHIFFRARKRFKSWTPKRIQLFQYQKAVKIIQFAKIHSKFYASHLDNVNFEGTSKKDKKSNISMNIFQTIPIIDKTVMMNNFTDYNTVGLTKEECLNFCLRVEESRDYSQKYKKFIMGLSTGTSGNRGIELVSAQEARALQTTFISRFPIPRRGRFHLAFILRVFSPGFNVNIGKYRMSYISPMDTLENIIDELNNLQPTALSAPPSMLKILAEAKQTGDLQITPDLVVSYAEVLTPEVKKLLQKIFTDKIYEVYKGTEGLFAQSCKYGRMHINEDLTYLEVVDEDNLPIPPGSPGNVIITDLIKHTTPMIRYRLNDIITIDPELCPCGSHFRVIKQIQGRADDIFLGERSDTHKAQFVFGDYIRRAIVTTSDHIREYRANQISPTSISITIETLSDHTTKEEHDHIRSILPPKISHLFTKHKCLQPTLQIVFEEIHHDFRHKLRRIIRNFDEIDFFNQKE